MQHSEEKLKEIWDRIRHPRIKSLDQFVAAAYCCGYNDAIFTISANAEIDRTDEEIQDAE
jgi:hypothetical protein